MIIEYWINSVGGYENLIVNVRIKKINRQFSRINYTEGIHPSPTDSEPLWNSIWYQINRKKVNTIHFTSIQHESGVHLPARTKYGRIYDSGKLFSRFNWINNIEGNPKSPIDSKILWKSHYYQTIGKRRINPIIVDSAWSIW